jgi:8-oxo-dGTP diphosphatase
VIFTLRDRRLQVLLIQRKSWPFEGAWAIPGGFVQMDESLEQAARRELEEETGVRDIYLEQLRAFGDPARDPRTRVITVAFMALVSSDKLVLQAATDAADARWFPIDQLPVPLAFDHAAILEYALAALRRRLESGNIARELLPNRFTLTQLQEVYETLLGQSVDKRNFRKWVLAANLVLPTDQTARGPHRPAQLYEFALGSPNDARFVWNVRRKESSLP